MTFGLFVILAYELAAARIYVQFLYIQMSSFLFTLYQGVELLCLTF
jgi:hypothetical protein